MVGRPAEPFVPPDWWPVFFAAVDISASDLELKAGDLFIVQIKSAIRDYLRGVVPDIDELPLHRVPLLKVLTVPPKAYLEILEKRANYDDAVAILRQHGRWRGGNHRQRRGPQYDR